MGEIAAMSGWVKIHRKVLDNPMYAAEPFTRMQAWFDLILIANYKDGFFIQRGIRVEVKRGQVGHSIETLAKRWKWSRGKVERFIFLLENDSQIVRQKNNVTTLLSIVNYDEYQADDNPNGKTNGHQTVKQTSTNNKNKKNKEEKEIIFDSFWAKYPIKVAKDKCKAKFIKLPDSDIETIMATIDKFAANKPFADYRHPNPETYLNQKRWEDEIANPKDATAGQRLTETVFEVRKGFVG